MRKILPLLIVLILSGQSMAGKYAGSFLELGVGAKALGMGSAFVAVSNDAYGFYWNPSGLAFMENLQAASMYADLFNSLESQSFLSVAMPVFGGVTISAAWMRLSVNDIPRYPGFNPGEDRVNGVVAQLTSRPNGYFASASDAFVLSFAKYKRVMLDLGWQYFEFPIDFGYGVNFKILRESIDDKSGSGIGLDAGMMVKIGLENVFNDPNYGQLVFGINIQDISETRISWNTLSKQSDKIQRNFKYGFAFIQPLNFVNSEITFAFDLDTRYGGSTHFGGEYLYDKLLALRAGVNEGNFTAGAGIYLWKLNLDYAFQSHDLGNTHRVSLLFHL